MVSWTTADQNAYEARRRINEQRLEVLEGCEKESKLHEQICNHCDKQWPKWKYIHARTDKRSTIEEGAQDFTIFLPGCRVLCIECKAKGKKPDEKQRDWAFEMQRLEHTVHCIRSFEEFLNLLTTTKDER